MKAQNYTYRAQRTTLAQLPQHLDAHTIMANGAEVIASTESIVLCRWRGELVTWAYNPANLACYWGHYFGGGDLVSAYANFLERAGI